MKCIHLVYIAIILFGASCVSTKKYADLDTQRRTLEVENLDLMKRISNNRAQITDLQAKAEELAQVRQALNTTSAQRDGLQSSHDQIQQQYDDLLAQNQEVINTAGTEKAQLSGELADQKKLLDQKERELNLLERKLQSQQENLRTLQEDIRIRERRLQDLTYEMQEQDSIMTALRTTVSDALTGFSDADLQVTEREGKIYVSLSQNLLFAKGSSALDNAGRDAIRKLARVLKEHPDILINVEGHTDSDGTPNKNWDLSVTRATSVVKQLTASGLDPSQVTASGRAFYAPLVLNDVEENKSLNRRTEIILAPRLDVLYNLIER